MSGLEQLANATKSRSVVGIVGGAVAGSEAAALCAKRGAIAIVVEQSVRPFGKIEDGLPRWHHKLRDKEYAKIGENLRTPGVVYVPKTNVGGDIPWETFYKELGLSAIVLANGAWRDRPLPVDGINAYVDKGLVYQNPFVYWFNHYKDAGYNGQHFEILDESIVIGGGLASIDVAKIINLELYARALAKRGIEVNTTALEVKGIPRILEANGIEAKDLNIKGCTLYYRRRKKDMPLASGDTADPEKLAKLQKTREKIMDRIIRKYLVNFTELHRPLEALTDGERLKGIRFARTQQVDGRLKDIPGETVDVRAPMILSSIGSVPSELPGIPMRGELYDFANWETGELKELPGVFGLGNVLTGQGNIIDSRRNAIKITDNVVGPYLGIGIDIGKAIQKTANAAVEQPRSSIESQHAIAAWVKNRWEEHGYEDYEKWLAKHPA